MGAPEFNSLGGYEEPLEAYEAGPSLMSEMVKPDSVQSTPNQSFLKHQMVYSDLQEHSSQIRISTEWTILTSLRARYPNATVTITSSASGLLSFANAGQAKATLDTSGDRLVSLRTYKPATGRSKAKPGTFGDQVKFGKYDYQWNQKTFIVYEIIYTEGWCSYTNHFIVYKNDEEDRVAGRSKATDELIAAAAQYLIDTHDEVLVFDQEQWTKSNDLWKSVQESSWEDVILDETLKNSLVNEVTSFFDCRNDYKEFAVPWKRGIILHGLPGNGKTISIKALMHNLYSRSDPIPTLYVKSLAGCGGSHYAIRQIFVKARETAPCLLVFEDIDSLITDDVKSFFLNEVDGLESNDGILMIGSTNYLERLDAGIAKRPSRFDRKYHFALPGAKERALYCEYWRSKLAKNKFIDFPAQLPAAIADITDEFSFAYLKEAFITTLLVIVVAQRNGTIPELADSTPECQEADDVKSSLLFRVFNKQVGALRDELTEGRKSVEQAAKNKEGDLMAKEDEKQL